MSETGNRRQYGNTFKPRTYGLGKFDRKGTMVIGAAVFTGFIIINIFQSLSVKAAVVLILILVGVLTYARDKHGMTALDRISERSQHMISRFKRRNIYKAPLTGSTPLPPPLSSTYLSEHVDGYGRSFALIHYPEVSQVAVVLRCQPIGGELYDEDTINSMVAAWGGFGAAFADQPGVAQYTSTVETGPSYGYSDARAVEGFIDPDAPERAQQITRETAAQGTTAKNVTTVNVAVTFNISTKALRATKNPDNVDDMIAGDVKLRLPFLIEQLKAAGAGLVRPATKDELPENVRLAYDPGMAETIESARASGAVANIDWPEAGPASAISAWDHYVHDSGVSVTFRMTAAPQGTITHDSFSALFGPHISIHRKRVVLMRHVIDSAEGIDIAESSFNNARTRAEATRATATDLTARNIAERVRNEVANGSPIERFTVLITVTVLNPEELPDAVAAVEHSLARMARIRTRIMYGSQELAFAAGLGIGFDINAHTLSANLTKAIQ